MVFTKVLTPLDGDGPRLETALARGAAMPGGSLTGVVRLRGGDTDCDIARIVLEVIARVAAPGRPEEEIVCARFSLPGSFRLRQGDRRSLLFDVRLPWETPVTELSGGPLGGCELGVRTELAVDAVRGKGALVPLPVAPSLVQGSLLGALDQLGFGFTGATLEHGVIDGTSQRLPLYQLFTFAPAPQYATVMRELAVVFLANPGGAEVILGADRPGGQFSYDPGPLNRHVVSHRDAARRDWVATAEVWVRQLVASHGHHSLPARCGQGATSRPASRGRAGHREVAAGPPAGARAAGAAGPGRPTAGRAEEPVEPAADASGTAPPAAATLPGAVAIDPRRAGARRP